MTRLSPQSDSKRFIDDVILVSGGGSSADGIGIGAAIAMSFAAEGANVCVADIDLRRAQETCRAINEKGGLAEAHQIDVSDEGACEQLVGRIERQCRKLDVLINNVGVTGPTEPLDQVNMQAWSETMDINLRSAVQLTKYVIPAMVKAGGGSIVNISSIAGRLSYGASAYGPSKAALTAFTRELAVMYGRAGIRANSIAPGHLWTPMALQSIDPNTRALRRKIAPLNIEGDAWDVASATLFLASKAARFITGVEIPVDGGATIIGPLAAHAYAIAGKDIHARDDDNES